MLTPAKPEDEDQRLAMVHSLQPLLDQSDPVLTKIVGLAKRLSGASAAFISLMEADHQRFVVEQGLALAATDRTSALCAHAILKPQAVLWIADARKDPRFHDNPLVTDAPGVRFYAGAPLVVHGRAVGTFCVIAPEPREYDAELAELLTDLAGVAAERMASRHKKFAVERALEAASDAFIVADDANRYVYWSRGAEALFGFSAEEALGRTGVLLGVNCQDLYQIAWAGAVPEYGVSDGGRVETTAVRKDGVAIDIEVSLAVWHENGSRRTGAAIRDISQRKAQADALLRSKGEAEAANIAKSAFLANMSHELRTPLNGVIGVVDLLSATALTDHQRDLAGIIQSSADQLRSIIGDILDLARVEAGELVIAEEVFELDEELDRVRRLCVLKAAEKGLSLSVEQAPDAAGARVVGDPVRLRQVLINLVNNAIKFTPAGSVSLSMKRCGDETFRFEVRDTGIGFSREQRAALFDRFQQADATITRRFGGAGLGLTISRELVEAMGGSIDCDAVPGEGAVFWFELALPTGEASHGEAGLEAPEPLTTGRILVADDNRTNLRVVELILHAAGVATTAVQDGLEALETYKLTHFDAVLMDMMMPRMDGLAATRAIRRLEAETGRPRTPLIMLTANALPEHVAMALEAGADLHLSKPITPATLLGALETVCGAADASLSDNPLTPGARGPGGA